MTNIKLAPYRVQDHLIEQPSWGGRYIVDLKGLGDDPAWRDKKVGQSYEMASHAMLIEPEGGDVLPLRELIARDPKAALGAGIVDHYGTELSLLIKLTQAKGNSFQVHLPEGKTRGHWKPKPEAWFYLAPGLYTFGLKRGTSFEAYSQVLRAIESEMARMSQEVTAGTRTLDDARAQAQQRIRTLDPYAYVNLIEAATDDIVDLTPGGIHHSWEENAERFPQGNLVYEVQLDVPDDLCSMRGFDKGKILDDGSLRKVHVEDYLATIERDDAHNDIAQHVQKPRTVAAVSGGKTESIFRTPYFEMDRLTIDAGSTLAQSAGSRFHHLFVHAGSARIGGMGLARGASYFLPAALHEYVIESPAEQSVIFKTTLPDPSA